MSNKMGAKDMKQKPGREIKPRLRFPEFRDAGGWEEHSLEDISDRIVEKVGTTVLTPVSITAGYGFVSQKSKFGKDIAGDQYKNYIFLKYDDFAYNKGNSKKYPQGCVCQLTELPQAAAPNAFICFRLKEGYQGSFIQPLFDKNRHGNQLIKYITSGARSDGLLNINPADFFKTKFSFPRDYAEQQKIADCLSSLDSLITAQTQKLDTLKSHKKGLMQQLFPAEGKTVPRLRFPEFRDAGEWKEKSLGELSLILRGGSPRPIDEYMTPDADGLNWLKIGDVNQDSKYVTVTKERVLVTALKKTREVNPGDLIMSNSMSFGRPYILKIKACIHDGWIAITKISKQANRDYLYYLILSPTSQSYFLSQAAGSGVKNLNADIIKLLPALTPSLAEQQKIADCLSSVDEVITAQTQKLDMLKAHKKALMQQLFPQVEEGEA